MAGRVWIGVAEQFSSYGKFCCSELDVPTTHRSNDFRPTGAPDVPGLSSAAWSWSGGFVVGRLSRQTLWVSVALCLSPCLFCLVRFPIPSLSRFSLLVFLLPAVMGVFQGLRSIKIKLRTANRSGCRRNGVDGLSSRGLWLANWSLIRPVWYIVATAQRSSECTGR
jgi:hypothetical protein